MIIALINGPSENGSLFVREGRCTQQSSIWSTQWPPISLAYLAAITKQKGHRPFVLDCPAKGISSDALVESLKNLRPNLCVVSVSTPSFFADMQIAAALKEAVPTTKIAVIGAHVSAMDIQTLDENPQIDFVIRNEPEETFGELLSAIAHRRPVDDIQGLSYWRKNGPDRACDRPFIDDPDLLPFPAWESVDLSPYKLPFSRSQFLLLSPLRGCPHACSFCTAGTYYGNKVRLRTPDSVVREIQRGREQFKVNDFFMWAETFTLNRNFVMNLTEAMQQKTPGIRWTCNSRTDTVDEQMLENMQKAGCWMVGFGFESFSNTVLENAGKSIEKIDYDEPLRMARKAGITTLGHFILGLPGETPDSMKTTIRKAMDLDLDFVQFYTAAPFVGSKLFTQATQEGLLEGTEFSKISQSTASLQLEDLPPEMVDRARKKATLGFYLRPKRVYGLIRFAGFGLFLQIGRLVHRWIFGH